MATARRVGARLRVCGDGEREQGSPRPHQQIRRNGPSLPDGPFLVVPAARAPPAAPFAPMLRIAIPNKGRLAGEARALFADAGLEIRARSDRALTASIGGEFEALFVRARDVPELVADGAADAGITGHDLVAESGRPLRELLDLGFGRCRLVLAASDESGVSSLDDLRRAPEPPRVATAFPATAGRFFADRRVPVQLVPVSGACEIAPHLGIADVIVDLTSTGSTLRVNGLREVDSVLDSTARLVASPTITRSGAQALEELVTALASVIRARGQRYVMANVPRQALEAVRSVLPGLRAPTVINLLNGGTMVAVHAVVPASAIYRTIASLKTLGGEGILVTRIERLMP